MNLLSQEDDQGMLQTQTLEALGANLYLFPHEFLSLACNAKKRVTLLERSFKPEFGLKR